MRKQYAQPTTILVTALESAVRCSYISPKFEDEVGVQHTNKVTSSLSTNPQRGFLADANQKGRGDP